MVQKPAIHEIIKVNLFKSLKFFSFVSTIILLPIPAVHALNIIVTNPITEVNIK